MSTRRRSIIAMTNCDLPTWQLRSQGLLPCRDFYQTHMGQFGIVFLNRWRVIHWYVEAEKERWWWWRQTGQGSYIIIIIINLGLITRWNLVLLYAEYLGYCRLVNPFFLWSTLLFPSINTKNQQLNLSGDTHVLTVAISSLSLPEVQEAILLE